ncbi:MAG TPA: cysteine desulfurase-like protein [Gemmatimonadales bacterium]|nr:cysteine desulfurase-like protein [Gemmatimonadales bacterium]
MRVATSHQPTCQPVADIRAAFPALARNHQGRPVAYFDGPGGTQVPRQVVGAMEDYLLHHNANTHWPYPTSAETDAIIISAREILAEFLGAWPSEIAFGANMTTLTFHLARALGRSWGPGDTIVITELDHHANVAPWQALQRERGIQLLTVPLVPTTGQLDWEHLEKLLLIGPRLLAIGGASNALGTINDITRATSLAQSHRALTFVDAVHLAPHELIDVRKIGCDFLACSAYKFYGPHLGILYAKEDVQRRLDLPKLAPAPDTAPERLETGTLNHEGIAGAAAAVDYLASLSAGETRRACLIRTFAELRGRGQKLLQRLWSGLGGVPGVTLYGPEPDAPRTPTVAFTVAGQPADQVARQLAEQAVFVTSGDFYAPTVVQRLGAVEGLVRAGCACYTTADEVERLIDGVRQLV